MGDIIKAFWAEIWSSREDSPSLTQQLKHFRDYNHTIDPNHTPLLPDTFDLLEIIHSTNNSCAGPDGVPFFVYRTLAESLAPAFVDVIKALARGDPAPPGFNHARLFIIPKNDSIEIKNTRPISVTNSDNRIIAIAIARAITPALQALLHLAQKGFIPGRNGTQHVHDLTTSFYSHLDKQTQMFILFLDTKKAFDSIDHNHITFMLNHTGFPLWVSNIIEALLANVAVHPELGVITNHPIDILRGVKQGCPLSPLLFALSYDPLVRRLANIDNSCPHAFADDIAQIAAALDKIVIALHTLTTFSSFSGLGLNLDKTHILSTLPTTYSDRSYLNENGFSLVEFVEKETYLGVLFGTDISTIDIYRKALDKFTERVTLFRNTIRSLTLHYRILLFNTFLTPLFSYLSQFYVIPYNEVIRPVRELTRTCVIPYHGGGFAYTHIIAPTRDAVAPHTPLRDLWATNIALLATLAKPSTQHGVFPPTYPNWENICLPSWGSLITSEHAIYAAMVYLDAYTTLDENGKYDLDHLSDTPAKCRRTIYTALVSNSNDYKAQRSEIKFTTSLHNKIKYFLPPNTTPTDANIANIKTHLSTRTRIKPAPHNTHFRLIMHALPTDHRRNFVGNRTPPKVRGPPSNPYPCFFCGEGPDRVTHIFGNCPVVAEAKRMANTHHNLPNTPHSIAHSLLITPFINANNSRARIYFNYTVWKQRNTFFSTLNSPPDARTAARRITRAFSLVLSSPKVKDDPEVIALARQPPPDALTVYTDGSADPNPGPCGAGVFFLPPKGTPGGSRRWSRALGNGTNNLGELWAMAMALQAVIAHDPPANTSIIIFTDSEFVVGVLELGYSRKSYPALINALRRLYKKVTASHTIYLYWIRGHTNIKGNCIADEEAGVGSKASAAGQGLTIQQRNQLINNCNF